MQNVSIVVLCCVVKEVVWGFCIHAILKPSWLILSKLWSWPALCSHCSVLCKAIITWSELPLLHSLTSQSTIEGGGCVFWDSFTFKWVNFIHRRLLSQHTQGNYLSYLFWKVVLHPSAYRMKLSTLHAPRHEVTAQCWWLLRWDSTQPLFFCMWLNQGCLSRLG